MEFTICLFISSNVLYETLEIHGFAKMAVSPLITVRLSKFKIWHAQGSGADLTNVSDVTRDVTRARDAVNSELDSVQFFLKRHLRSDVFIGNQRPGMPSSGK